MPDELYAIDPRITRANALLTKLQAGGALRVPRVEKRLHNHHCPNKVTTRTVVQALSNLGRNV